ncbi:MAG: hypothetical protein AAFQ87_28095, partial [Bacteroidota bacterium]
LITYQIVIPSDSRGIFDDKSVPRSGKQSRYDQKTKKPANRRALHCNKDLEISSADYSHLL